MNAVAQSSFAGVRVQQRVARPRVRAGTGAPFVRPRRGPRMAKLRTGCPRRRSQAAARAAVTVVAAERPMWFPGAVAPSYLDGSLAGDRGELRVEA